VGPQLDIAGVFAYLIFAERDLLLAQVEGLDESTRIEQVLVH
jgi:hypothetical protein